MALVPSKRDGWGIDPFREMESLQKEMNRLFDFSLSRQPFGDTALFSGQWAPAIDVYDSRDSILVKADLPGLKKEEIEVSIQNDNLIVKGEKKRNEEIKEENYYRTERFCGSFLRTIPLPCEVDASRVQANYKEGVLELILPKSEEAKPKKIKIDVK
jgi:HSP20 family protein